VDGTSKKVVCATNLRQINPRILGELLSDPDPEKSKRVMEAMLKMKKIDIKVLQQAYEAAVK